MIEGTKYVSRRQNRYELYLHDKEKKIFCYKINLQSFELKNTELCLWAKATGQTAGMLFNKPCDRLYAIAKVT